VTTSTIVTVAATTTSSLQLLQSVGGQDEDPDQVAEYWWIFVIIGIVVCCCCFFVCAACRRRDGHKQVQAKAPVAIVSGAMLESMMVADHGADLGGWQQSENAQLWGQENSASPGSPEGYLEVDGRLVASPGGAPLSGVQAILGQINQWDEPTSVPTSVTTTRPKRVLFDMNSPGGASQQKPWEDIYPTQHPADDDEPIYATNMAGLPVDADEFNRREAKKAKDHKRTMRRRMSFFSKGGKTRGKLTREQLKFAEAQRVANEAAERPSGSMPGTMARPVVIDDAAAMKLAASKPAAFRPGGLGQDFLRKTGRSVEDVRLQDAERKQQWLERFNNNTVWDPSQEKWIYEKLDAWMSWGLAPREFEEPIYEPLKESETATNYSAAASSVPVSEFDAAADRLGDLARASVPSAVPPPVPSTLNRQSLSTLNRGPIKPPTVTVVNAGGGGLVTDRILEDRPLGAVGTGITSISGHFDPTGHSGYLSMRPGFPDEAEVPRPQIPAFGQGPAHFHPT
jgi:hypothetical protein